MKIKIKVLVLILSGIFIHNSDNQAQSLKNRPYQNPKLSADARADDLLTLMTMDEKIGQMTQLCASSITLDGTKKLDLNVRKIRDYILNQHIGSFLSGTGTAEKWVEFVKGIQEVAMKETRLGIPVLFGMDNVHGSNYTDEATMLPHNLNLGCTFNPKLAEESGRITAIESADLGHIWNFAPVLDVGKNPNWPRLYETFGEDPLVCGTMGSSFIKSFQNCKEIEPYHLSACAKHFIGYSDPKSGWDRTPSEIPDQVLNEFFVPPFKMAFDAGVKTLMVNSGELNGEAVHGSKKLLTDLLRKKLGFDGVILTDIKDILKMVEMHGAFANEKDATLAAIDAGIDMSMACSNTEFYEIVKQLVAEGKITSDRINESVKRILKLKFELSLFENPYPRKNRLSKIGSEENYKKALQAAKESIVLLKNDGNVLPFGKNVKNVLVAGIGSNSKKMLNGAWTLEWLGAEEARQPKKTKTLLEALKYTMPDKNFDWVDSVGFESAKPFSEAMKQFDLWQQKAKKADALVIAIGEQPYSEFKGNISDLRLSTFQEQLIGLAEASGKPVVVVLLEGRPRILPELNSKNNAILFAGYPGTAGGEALAQIMAGQYDPSGRLCFTYPKSVGHNTPYYRKKSEKYEAAFPFGHGLHFEKIEYTKVSIEDTLVPISGEVKIKISISNPGNNDIDEAILIFNKDEVGKITRPVSKLIAFRKEQIPLKSSKNFDFVFKAKDLCSFPDETGKLISEPGYHTITVQNHNIRFRIQ